MYYLSSITVTGCLLEIFGVRSTLCNALIGEDMREATQFVKRQLRATPSVMGLK